MRDIDFYNPPAIHTHEVTNTIVEVETLPRYVIPIMAAGIIGFILSILELITHGL
jgi:hypothetical protein